MNSNSSNLPSRPGRSNLNLALCLSLLTVWPAAEVLAAPTRASMEIQSLRTLEPLIKTWRKALRKGDMTAAHEAAERYEAQWQGIEVYPSHRSVVLYRDMEVDTQFVIEAEMENPNPDQAKLAKLFDHLRHDLNACIVMAKTGPKLSPLFDDLIPLRGLRGRTLLIIRDELATQTPDLNKVRALYQDFKDGLPHVSPLIEARSPTAMPDIRLAVQAAEPVFASASSTVGDLVGANTALLDRFGYAINLLNAAARNSNLNKTGISDTDKKNLTQLNLIRIALEKNVADAGDTSPGSIFGGVQGALEGLGRYLNAVGTLRTALVNYDKAMKGSPQSLEKARKSAMEAVAITQQVLVGQFWGSAELESFLATLPKS